MIKSMIDGIFEEMTSSPLFNEDYMKNLAETRQFENHNAYLKFLSGEEARLSKLQPEGEAAIAKQHSELKQIQAELTRVKAELNMINNNRGSGGPVVFNNQNNSETNNFAPMSVRSIEGSNQNRGGIY